MAWYILTKIAIRAISCYKDLGSQKLLFLSFYPQIFLLFLFVGEAISVTVRLFQCGYLQAYSHTPNGILINIHIHNGYNVSSIDLPDQLKSYSVRLKKNMHYCLSYVCHFNIFCYSCAVLLNIKYEMATILRKFEGWALPKLLIYKKRSVWP